MSLRICKWKDLFKLYVKNQIGYTFGNHVWLMIVYYYTKIKNRFHKKKTGLFYYIWTILVVITIYTPKTIFQAVNKTIMTIQKSRLLHHRDKCFPTPIGYIVVQCYDNTDYLENFSQVTYHINVMTFFLCSYIKTRITFLIKKKQIKTNLHFWHRGPLAEKHYRNRYNTQIGIFTPAIVKPPQITPMETYNAN